ncbi:hypothetical protein [Flavobacterium sp. MMS24-S5]|uniref:hypothetical protein n=1 Tax=Flavobacterium sp. MMS24-S5 TaxID=3416605 RepID=UPI003CFD0387
MEDQIHPKDEFIVIDGYFSGNGIKSVKDVVEKRFENRLKTDFYNDFINWSKAENEILLGTFRASAAWPLLTDLGCVFDFRNPEKFVYQEFKLVHSLVNGWIPAESTSIGNNHIVAVRFERQIPEMLHELYEESEYHPNAPIGCLQLGICRKKDFPIILENIRKNRLKSESDY